MSFFAHASAAQRYAAARPFFHPVVRDRILRRLGDSAPLDRALDIACGTGQSTIILEDLARFVVGIDRSAEMLALAANAPSIRYVRSSAEMLPFADASIDLVTVALAFHWFQRDAFLRETSRVLRPHGWLVIYDNSFSGRMRGNQAFEKWIRERYLTRYPTPPRNRTPFSSEDARPYNLELLERQTYTNEVEFNLPELISYLMTQSNVIAAVEEGVETLDSVRAWLARSLQAYFQGDTGVFLFGGPISILQRSEQASIF